MTHRFKDRLAQLFAFSLLANFLSLKILPTVRHILSKTLDFLKMDSLFFSADGGDDDSLFGNSSARSIQSLSDLDDERLYLVDHRWWNETRESLFREVNGILYPTSSGLSDDFDLEIILEMRTSESDSLDCRGEEQGVSGREYALVSEWMFYRALKCGGPPLQMRKNDFKAHVIFVSGHYDMKYVGNSVAIEDNKADFFSLQVRLSISATTNSLVVRISQKGNEIGAFNKSCQIFCVKSGLLNIWDFSGQITKFFLQGSMLSDKSEQVNEEVYGLSFDVMRKENGMAVEDLKTDGFSSGSSLKVNGHSDNVNSCVRLGHPPFPGSFSESYNLGLTGLYNLGNTCFMNSAIQCLVHTPQLVNYFLGDFRKDLNFENPLGMNGKLALAFGDLLRQLWTPGATSVAPRAFKSRVAGFAPQFSGYNQHDSQVGDPQEFLAFLLDGLHEDLNRVKIKPYNEIKDTDGVSDKEVADEHWQNHLARNDSIIVGMCQGQYRSTLICPLCKKHSVTFDPFIYLSLPLPSTTMRTMTLTVLSTDGTTLPISVIVTVPKCGKFTDLIQALSIACSLREDETLLVAEVYIQPPLARIPDCTDGSKIQKKFLKLLHPFLMPDEFSSDAFDDSVNTVNQDIEMEEKVDENAFNGVPNSEVNDRSFVDDNFQFYFVQQEHFSEGTKMLMDEPLLIPESRKITVLVSWPEEMLKRYDTCILSHLPETGGLSSKKPPESASLYKCLEAFLKEEPLGPEDMYCPKCLKHCQASKKLDLWRLPEILIIHLKRFSYNQFLKDKLETFVDFPIDNFDLSNYTVHKEGQSSFLYKLYAVSNHYGGMGGGHYTAFVQCGQQWYEFNDSQVFPISEDQIKTSAAY
ncbi:Peptidase C19, ubiquitin carboxyl-terminal hydrolase 2, partial [Cynara cardunculus var. scolymus]